MKYRLVYAGCNYFSSVFESLLSRPDVEIVLCLTGERDSPHVSQVVRSAKRSSVPIHYGRFTPALVHRIKGSSANVMLCAAYSHRVPVAELGIEFNLNLHPTLLPQGRGPNPMPYLVDGYSQFSGLTVHEMSPRFDDGDILDQLPVPVQIGWGFNELALAMHAHAPKLVNRVFNDLDELYVNRRPQGEGSYWPKPSRADRTVRWAESASTIAAKSRRFGSVGVLCSLDGIEYNIVHPMTAIEVDHSLESGSVVFRSPGATYVAVEGGMIRIETSSGDVRGAIPWRHAVGRLCRRAARTSRSITNKGIHTLRLKFLENIGLLGPLSLGTNVLGRRFEIRRDDGRVLPEHYKTEDSHAG
jgi:methionyl-tRNA formyltransferase